MKCLCCPQPLRTSLSAQKNGTYYKSCPECSDFDSEHVFYPLEAFGNRDVLGTEIQSWCISCRIRAESERKIALDLIRAPNYTRVYVFEKLKCRQLLND
ncbi:hypothetical protein CTM84_02510 [Photobacterium kishitanii]|nr:hypothetical protein CTM84_02510 [Photobacterium kishitanii]